MFLEDGVMEGRFPPRALRAVLEWYDLRRTELEEDWKLAMRKQPLKSIRPLE